MEDEVNESEDDDNYEDDFEDAGKPQGLNKNDSKNDASVQNRRASAMDQSSNTMRMSYKQSAPTNLNDQRSQSQIPAGRATPQTDIVSFKRPIDKDKNGMINVKLDGDSSISKADQASYNIQNNK